jgi:hypothetical protein
MRSARVRSLATVAAAGVLAAVALTASPAAAAVPIEHPTGANDLVLAIDHTRNGWGGEYSDGYDVKLYGDGRLVIAPPPVDDETPPKARVVELDERGIQRILRRAARAGLLADTEYGEAGVTDQGTSTIRVDAGGKVREVHVYALLLEQGDPGLPREQRAARRSLRRFVHAAADPSSYVVKG